MLLQSCAIFCCCRCSLIESVHFGLSVFVPPSCCRKVFVFFSSLRAQQLFSIIFSSDFDFIRFKLLTMRLLLPVCSSSALFKDELVPMGCAFCLFQNSHMKKCCSFVAPKRRSFLSCDSCEEVIVRSKRSDSL